MKALISLVAATVLTLVCGVSLIVMVLRFSGVRHVYLTHVIATVEFGGVESPAQAQALERRFADLPGLRETALARTTWASDVWMARLQFKAADPLDGAQRIHDWLATLPASQTNRLVKATFYRCRLARPERGDIVLGKPRPLPPLDGT